MKTASYVLEQANIDYVKDRAKEIGGKCSDSHAMRVILTESMQIHMVAAQGRDGKLRVDPAFSSAESVVEK